MCGPRALSLSIAVISGSVYNPFELSNSIAVLYYMNVFNRKYRVLRWPELVPELLKVAGIGDTHQELVALVLTSLSDEASSTGLSGSMPSKRQSDIMQVRRLSRTLFQAMIAAHRLNIVAGIGRIRAGPAGSLP